MTLVSLAAVASTASLLAVAAAAKIIFDRQGPPWMWAVAVVEACAALMVVIPTTRLVGLSSAVALGAVFVVYTATRREAPCRCFGARIAAATYTGQLLRS